MERQTAQAFPGDEDGTCGANMATASRLFYWIQTLMSFRSHFSFLLTLPTKQHFDFSSAVISPLIKNVAHQVSNINQAPVAKCIFLTQQI